MDEKEECKEKVFLDLIEIGQIYQDMNDPNAQAVLIFGGRAYCIDINLLTNRLLKYDTETLTITEMRRY
jgi:hypothetical protein